MYALAVLSFDEDTSIAFDTAPDEATHRDPAYLSRMLLWYICSRMVEAHSLLSEQPLAQRHRTQFDVFFQYMNSSVNGARLVQAVTRAGPVPVFYRPHTREGDPLKAALDNAKANSAPSGLHLQVVTHLVMYLQRLLDHARSTFSDESDTISAASSSSSSSSSVAINKHDFVCVNEFAGLALAFPVDVAVFRGGNLRALVEIDGDFHYTANGDGQRVLHRVDQLKEHLYRLRYPDVPFFRVRTDQVRYMGLEGACTELALKILKVSLLY